MPNLKTRDGREVALRYLTCGDGPALQQFNTALSHTTRDLFLPHAYDDATIKALLNRAECGKDYVVVALDGDIIIAYAFLWEMDDPVPVLGIGIADAWQGQGLGQPLMAHLIDTAKREGRDGIELTTVPENKRAFALYQKMGFQHTGDTDNIAGDGRVVREHVMFLALQPGTSPPVRAFKPPV